MTWQRNKIVNTIWIKKSNERSKLCTQLIDRNVFCVFCCYIYKARRRKKKPPIHTLYLAFAAAAAAAILFSVIVISFSICFYARLGFAYRKSDFYFDWWNKTVKHTVNLNSCKEILFKYLCIQINAHKAKQSNKKKYHENMNIYMMMSLLMSTKSNLLTSNQCAAYWRKTYWHNVWLSIENYLTAPLISSSALAVCILNMNVVTQNMHADLDEPLGFFIFCFDWCIDESLSQIQFHFYRILFSSMTLFAF